MNRTFRASIISATALVVPFVALAATKTLATVIDLITYYLNRVLLLLMAVAVVMFVFYIIKYFIRADADRTEAGKYVMYSVIGFFVVLSFWGIVNVLQGTFGLGNENYRPSTWESFTNLFPSGSGGSNAPSFNNSGVSNPGSRYVEPSPGSLNTNLNSPDYNGDIQN